MTRLLLTCLVVCLFVQPISAQIAPPTGPVLFCGTQAPPAAASWTVSVDGGAATPLTMDVTMDARCTSPSNQSFRLPASLFPLGKHTVRVTSTNSFGSTVGVEYAVAVGVAPGQFTITAVHPG